MKVGDKVQLNDKARKLPASKRVKFKSGDKGKVAEVIGSLYVRVAFKKGALRCPRSWLDA